jgi:tetratricopeptide (TPR) repeat protein
MKMSLGAITEKLETLAQWEKIEDVSRRFALPYLPEYDLECFKTLYTPELSAARADLDAVIEQGGGPAAYAWRGRVLRIMGDVNGAAQDLKQALDSEPDLGAAHAWLGEMDLNGSEALVELDRALGADPYFAPARLYRGAACLSRGDAAGAARDFEKFLRLRPRSGLGLILLGAAEERMARRKSAFKAYAAAAKAAPYCSAAHLLCWRAAGSLAERRRRFHDAYNVSPVLGFITLQIHRTDHVESPVYMKRIVDFCFRDPEQVGAYYKREATQSHFSHFPAEDYGFVRRLVRANPGLSWAQGFYGRAACYTPAGATEGEAALSRGIALEPKAGWHYAWRANARRVLGKYKEALEDFDTSVRLQPFYHRAFVWRGALYRKLGRHREALRDLDRAVAMDPHYSLTYHERSMTLRALGETVASVSDLDRAFRLDHRYRWVFKTGGEPTAEDQRRGLLELDRALVRHPHATSLWIWRGQLKAGHGAISEAIEDFEHAVQMDPYHDIGFAWYGWALLKAGMPRPAVEKLEHALRLEPRLWIAHSWLAEALYALGRKKQARQCVAGVLKEKPKTPWAHFLMAQFDARDGARKSALKHLKRALLLDGKYPEAYLLLAQVLLDSGELRGAYRAIDHCIQIAPNIGRAYVVRAAIHQKAGKTDKVLGDYRTALKEFPYLFNDEQKAVLEKELAVAP